MTDKEFEKWWHDHRHNILRANAEYQVRENSYKMKGGADLLLFAIPIVVGILFLESGIVAHEMLNWLVSAVIIIVTFLICAFIKSQSITGDSLYDIEQRIKAEHQQRMVDEPSDQ